jgi:outer membrane protein assembly factor BamB
VSTTVRKLSILGLVASFPFVTVALGDELPAQIEFTSVPNFPDLPNGQNFGEVPGVAVNSDGHVFVFSRSAPALAGPAFGAASGQLFEFDSKGKFIRELGKGLYGWSEAHSVRVDKSDNIWAIDKGSNMVVVFNPAGRVIWVFGRKAEAADGAGPLEHPDPPLPPVDASFRQPTDVAWDSKGNIYITDGYVNSRVAKFDKNGDWVKSWGSKGSGPGQFVIPHSIAIDNDDNVYVGDRSNHRVQVFDTDGNFKRMFSVDVPPDSSSKAVNGETPVGERLKAAIGAPNSLCVTSGPNQVLFLGESTYPGRIFKLTLNGTLLGVIGRSGRNLGQFSGAHALACPSEHLLYVAETSNWRVQKLILR